MKVLVVSRLFSGLKGSLAEGRWNPSGVPAIYKLVENLACTNDINLALVILSREADTCFTQIRKMKLAPFGIDTLVLPWRTGWPNRLNELVQTIGVLAFMCTWRPDVAYFTNAGFVPAGLAARFRLAPIVFRFLGIFPVHKQLAEGGRKLARWLYRAPFAHVVCSLDGSGGEYYLKRLLDRRVPLSVLLNGVDIVTNTTAGSNLRKYFGFDTRPIITYLGRLERFKGADEFVAALQRLEQLRPDSFQALIIGDGPLKDDLECTLSASSLTDRVHFTGAIAHKEVAKHLAISDIYVSLNRYGGLSNANLEAIAAGRCILMLSSDPAGHIDLVTDELVPYDVIERLPRTGTVEALANALARLVTDPAEIDHRARAVSALADRLLNDWNVRIEREIAFITSAARPRRRPFAWRRAGPACRGQEGGGE